MKKTIIASKKLDQIGLHQVISMLNTNDCTIESEVYYQGRISKKETRYYEDNFILDISWDNEIKYYEENEYVIITK